MISTHRRMTFLACIVLLQALAACGDQRLTEYQLSGPTMGTRWLVKLVAPDGGSDEQDAGPLRVAIASRLAEINALMSTYDSDSELARFNRHASGAPFPVSPDTFEVFRVAREVSEWSGGAFDVTVGPLVAAWGFGATDRAPGDPCR